MKEFKCRHFLAAVCVAALPSGATAQQGSADTGPVLAIASPMTSGPCVLHVWPASSAKSSYMGWFHGGAVDGDRRGIKGYPAMHSDVLSTEAQQQLLNSIDWRSELAKPDLTVVVHDQPPAPQDDRSRTTALIADHPYCYRELLIHSVFVEKAALSTSTVRVVAIAKTWSFSGVSPTTYSTMTTERADLGNQGAQSIKSGFIASVQKILGADYFHRY